MFKERLKSGFTLVEMAIVLVIVGIILYGGIKLSAASFNMAKVKDSRAKLLKIEEALQLFFETNDRLPCPATGSVASSSASFGVEGTYANASSSVSDATCTYASSATASDTYLLGVVPTRTLNLPDSYMYDGWGNKITYSVSKHCIDPDNWGAKTSTAFTYNCRDDSATTADGGTITIKNIDGNTVNTSALAAYVVISHGKNNIGAWNKQTTRITTPCPGPANAGLSPVERDNAKMEANCTDDATPNVDFRDDSINDGNVLDGGGTYLLNYFDDLVIWKTPAQIYYIKACKDSPANC